jgi:hypothetical protein
MSSPDRKKSGIDYLDWIERYPKLIGLVGQAFIAAADYKFMYEARGQDNLQKVVSYVNNGEGGTVITPNHLSMFDLGLFLALRKRFLPAVTFGVPWANKFTGIDSGLYQKEKDNEDEENRLFGQIGEAAAKRRKIKLVSVPQESSDENSREAVKTLAGLRRNNLEKNGAVGIFIEGTRSRDGKLKIAKQGINRLFGSSKVRENTLILPVGLLGTNEVLPIGSKGINIQAKVETAFGKPLKYEQAKYEMDKYHLILAEVIMLHIAKLIPSDYWGVYKELFSKII